MSFHRGVGGALLSSLRPYIALFATISSSDKPVAVSTLKCFSTSLTERAHAGNAEPSVGEAICWMTASRIPVLQNLTTLYLLTNVHTTSAAVFAERQTSNRLLIMSLSFAVPQGMLGLKLLD